MCWTKSPFIVYLEELRGEQQCERNEEHGRKKKESLARVPQVPDSMHTLPISNCPGNMSGIQKHDRQDREIAYRPIIILLHVD